MGHTGLVLVEAEAHWAADVFNDDGVESEMEGACARIVRDGFDDLLIDLPGKNAA